MKNKLHLIIFSSALHDNASVVSSRQTLMDGLRRFAELDVVYPSMLSTEASISGQIDGGTHTGLTLTDSALERTLCFIATGGTEEVFRTYAEVLPRPVMLLSDGLHNSFAASFEIKSYLTQHGIPSQLFNAPLDENPDFYTALADSLFGNGSAGDTLQEADPLPKLSKSVAKAFEKTRVGLFGGASDWLIASGIDRDAVSKAYGATFVDISLHELEEEFAATPTDAPEIEATCARLARFLTDDRTPEHLRQAARMYLALRKLCTKYNLNALTLKCFGILNSCRTTSCLALALLNDEGVVAGCEGDIPSLWSMLYVRYAFGEAAFMANPSSSNRRECTIDFAHCTIPLSMVHGYRLPSHFESGTGIGIAGSVPSGRYRIVKLFGERLDRRYETVGDIIMNTNIPQRCRTQIRFRFAGEAEFDRFFRVSKGNHIILCKDAGPGDPSR